MTNDTPDIPTNTIAETDSYTIWTAVEPDDETTYHLELGQVTVHFFQEEWEEFIGLIGEASAAGNDGGAEEDVEVELDWGSLYFTREEWEEFLSLIAQVSEE
jgi:hypothetical protein